MSLIEVSECQTAEDVRRLSRIAKARRRAWYTVVVPEPELDIEPGPVEAPLVPEMETLCEVVLPQFIGRLGAIRRAVERAYRLEDGAVLAQDRRGYVMRARQVTYLLCFLLTKSSLPKIGLETGGKDHTTVLHGIRKLAWLKDQLLLEGFTVDVDLGRWINRTVELYPPLRPSRKRNRGHQ